MKSTTLLMFYNHSQCILFEIKKYNSLREFFFKVCQIIDETKDLNCYKKGILNEYF